MTNPYFAVLIGPVLLFLALLYFQADIDTLNLWGRGAVFALLGYINARYLGRAPVLVWKGNFSPEARNVVGFAIVLTGFALNVAYGWLYIRLGRPDWLSDQYWGVSFIYLTGLGLAFVASSVPRFPPFWDGRNGLGELASLVVVVASTLALFMMSHIPQVWTAIRGLWLGLAKAL